MPVKLTRQKVQKEARRAARSEALVARQTRCAMLIQVYFRLMFVTIPNDLYTHLQVVLMYRRPTRSRMPASIEKFIKASCLSTGDRRTRHSGTLCTGESTGRDIHSDILALFWAEKGRFSP